MARLKRGRSDCDGEQLLGTQLSATKNQSISQLRALWHDRFGDRSPAIRSSAVLRKLLSWRLQAEAMGDLDNATRRTLATIAGGLERGISYEPKVRRSLSAGVVLAREWKGVTHKVTVTTQGFQHLDKHYRSLSDIARTITGTRWSGPRFFGLEQKGRPKASNQINDAGSSAAHSGDSA